MAGPLLRILIRLKQNKYHRIQIAARYRILDLIKQIADDLHLTIHQLLHISIYRNGPNGCSLLYPLNNTHFDVLDKYGLTSDEELHIDLSDIIIYQDEEEDDDDENLSLTTNKESSTTNKNLSTIGQLIKYTVPSDNSCLFTSIDFVLNNGKLNLSSNKYLRNLVATKIESDEITYTDAILGRTNVDYCKWIRRDDSWGGGIELAILTQEYEIEICVINTESGGRIDHFGEDKHFPYRVFLLYDNLHYDPVYLVTYDIIEQKELSQTKFHRNNENILSLVKDLVNIEQSTKSEKCMNSKI
ncbi:unnamed protein product [Adineta steineri]|uniref:Ubiquitin thioesterase OTU n=1 Tax=Adineta steineri TaxID=433720 RepID=A0A813XJ95_9BILA|nr:unnamed protein product [Adineta steineri]CAF3515557.1 unnamed protein product [Adineta steineri]